MINEILFAATSLELNIAMSHLWATCQKNTKGPRYLTPTAPEPAKTDTGFTGTQGDLEQGYHGKGSSFCELGQIPVFCVGGLKML